MSGILNPNAIYYTCVKRRHTHCSGNKDVNKKYGLIPNISNYLRISNILSLNGNLGGNIVFGNNNTNVLVNTPPLKNKF